MKYGCIGEKLSHSFSKEIHEMIGGYEYSLIELKRCELAEFFKSRDFSAINVTIPYKEAVIPFLDGLDESAASVGAVNTVVNRTGSLIGYNTDIYGMEALIRRAKISVKGKKALILGSGGTAKTARAVLEKLGANDIITVSRTPDNRKVSYTDVYKNHTDAQIIINTTPVGMFPNLLEEPIDISAFSELEGVIDAIYNPERTLLLQRAEKRGINASGGLYMLVSQAIFAAKLFGKAEYNEELCDKIHSAILRKKRNIALIGMPSSGKSTVGKILADKLCRPFYDTDSLIECEANTSIRDIFEKQGEAVFRQLEAQKIKMISALHGAIISVGGGAPLMEDNVSALKQNSEVIYIKRPLSALTPTETRPLAATSEALANLYRERLPIYEAAADRVISADSSADDVAQKIIKLISNQ